MTKEELVNSHFNVRFEGDEGTTGDFAHTKVSIEYAISVLEDIHKWWEMGSENYARLEKKIKELKSLIHETKTNR